MPHYTNASLNFKGHPLNIKICLLKLHACHLSLFLSVTIYYNTPKFIPFTPLCSTQVPLQSKNNKLVTRGGHTRDKYPNRQQLQGQGKVKRFHSLTVPLLNQNRWIVQITWIKTSLCLSLIFLLRQISIFPFYPLYHGIFFLIGFIFSLYIYTDMWPKAPKSRQQTTPPL